MCSAHSFSNMMDESVEVENIYLFQPLPSADEEHDEDDTLISPTRKRGHRSANYSSDEDVALIRAWELCPLMPLQELIRVVALIGAASQSTFTVMPIQQ